MRVPPLRERREDIPVLADHFVRKFAQKCGKQIDGFSAASLAAMESYEWPGNVRELEHVVERGVILTSSRELDVTGDLHPGRAPGMEIPFTSDIPFREAKEKVVSAFEKSYIEEILRKSGGRLTVAARAAGMDNKNFSEKMKRYGITLGDYRG